jgi:hypothetical protein
MKQFPRLITLKTVLNLDKAIIGADRKAGF